MEANDQSTKKPYNLLINELILIYMTELILIYMTEVQLGIQHWRVIRVSMLCLKYLKCYVCSYRT